MTHALHGQSVGLHHITWRATGSAVSDVDVLVEALAWLIGDPEAVKTDKSSSYHGPELFVLSAITSNKRKAMRSFARLGRTTSKPFSKILSSEPTIKNVLTVLTSTTSSMATWSLHPISVLPPSKAKQNLRSIRANQQRNSASPPSTKP